MKIIRFSFSVFLLLIMSTGPASAYLDPGTGSMILQGLIAGLMVVATTLGVYWQRFLEIIYQVTGKDFRKPSSSEEDLEDETTENEG
jgi:hypothetical protein